MSEPRNSPAGIFFFLLFALLGFAATIACLAGAAQWMTAQGCSGTAVVPLTTAAVSIGSLVSAFSAAIWKRQRGLVTGLIQGTLFAGVLSIASMLNGTSAEPVLLIRVLAVLLCSSIGGIAGVALQGRRHPLP